MSVTQRSKKARLTHQQMALSSMFQPGMNPMAMTNPMAMMNPAMAAMFQQMSNPSAPSSGLTINLPAHTDDALVEGGEEQGEDGGEDEEHGEDVHQAVLTNESQRAAVTPKKSAPPVRPMSSNPTAGPFPQSQTKEPQGETSDVINEAVSRVMATRNALFKATKGEMPIPRSIKYLGAMPKVRLSQAIEACDPDLNATATSSLTEDGLRRVLWCLTRQRPLVPMSGLQVTLYNELFARLLVRHQQLVRRTVNSQSDSLVDSLVGRQCKDLKNETELVDSLVKQLTDSWGFDQGWLDELHAILKRHAEAKTKSRAKAIGAPAAMLELLQARPLMQAFAKAGAPAPRAGVLRPSVTSDPPSVPDDAAVTADASQHVESRHVENQSVSVPEPGEAFEAGEDLGHVDQPEDSDLPQCCICQKIMNHRTEELMALECSHVFHVACITECWTKLGKPQWWCPYKCTEHVSNVEDNDWVMGNNDDSAVGAPEQPPPERVVFEIHGMPSPR
ncbi:unnamed protein product [Cladocopium goreaui]|uniref:RING-type domain-containing protein n=1 Tax=Cladocopium goreaui TaxID=2562237 RepID=A0A9P1C1A1_9DINO|nr:unnamed protein product [Cladocopium goreaui]